MIVFERFAVEMLQTANTAEELYLPYGINIIIT